MRIIDFTGRDEIRSEGHTSKGDQPKSITPTKSNDLEGACEKS